MTMTIRHDRVGPILVLGANGKTGGRVAERLRAQGRDVRLGSRSASPRFDWEDRSSWTAALDGVAAVYVAYQPDLAVPGALEVVQAFFAVAERAGVKQVVLLSGRGEPEALDAERALQATTLDWTIIRASWFFQNFSEAFFLEGLLANEVVLPEGLADEPFVDAEDIADIAVEAFTEAGHSRKLYEVTGPRALSFRETVETIAAATGRDIAFVTIPLEAYREGLAQALPSEMVDLVIYLFTTVLDGRNTPVAHGVAQALGRPPGDFEAYVARTAATGVWSA
jgi:uncharacterized protein YbjT (DUF2867 family)